MMNIKDEIVKALQPIATRRKVTIVAVYPENAPVKVRWDDLKEALVLDACIGKSASPQRLASAIGHSVGSITFKTQNLKSVRNGPLSKPGRKGASHNSRADRRVCELYNKDRKAFEKLVERGKRKYGL
jgi:hypothetical protein